MVYVPRTKPRIQQVEALKRVRRRPKSPSPEDVFAWLMEYGTGKSKVICDEFGTREDAGDLQDVLILAGAGSYLNWIEDKDEERLSEFHKHLSDDLNERLRSEAWISGSGVRHMKRLDHLLKYLDPRRPRALLMNIEALSMSKKALDYAVAFMSSPKRRKMVVVDESTSIKEDSSQRTKAVLKLSESTWDGGGCRRILTGLVTPNNPVDLFSQFEFLDWRILGYQSKWAFRNHYCIMKPIEVIIPEKFKPDGSPATRKVNVDVAYRNIPELYEKIAPYSYRVLSKDCQDLPPLNYLPIIDVELTKEQRAIYDDLHEFSTAQLNEEDHVTATMVLTRNLRLQQVLCGFTVDENGVEHDIPSNRGAAVLRVLEEHAGKAIIWVPFHRPLQRLVSALQKVYGPEAVAQYHGKNLRERGDEERRWMGDPKCRFLLSTQSSGGRGNTWIEANLMIYFANTFDLELRMNSEKRFHRDGQTKSCAIVDFNTRGTKEFKTVQALRKKLDIATAIMGDDPKSWLI